ncbi:hypothetical protein [Ferrovum sp.]|uniref:hypothetical protein n=1 Tax=Ferrovum sp. TaxID=2609467 RepID=UPI00261579E5|nr:hypothetical protein [Ferrovum sp.]
MNAMDILGVFFVSVWFLYAAFGFLFLEYRHYRNGRDAWFWPTPKGRWLLRKLKLTGESRFARGDRSNG